jgi:hypothetical protein
MTVDKPKDQEPAKDLGVSDRAVALAKLIDRLRDGDYIILLHKPDMPAALWEYDIVRTDRIFKGTIVKKI